MDRCRKPVLDETTYVFTEAFYEMKSGQSILESLTLDYLKGKPIQLAQLSGLIERCRNCGRLEQYYYFPILLTLIKASFRNV